MKYRSEIDGLRALAVVPVILFHAGFELFGGGFIGVDVFFVISGYLITTIIISEMIDGKFNLINFYERRARRILPALFFILLICIPFAVFWLPPNDLQDFGQSLYAVSLFFSNFLFWLESGYFAIDAESKPLLHTWSLAVEEQFYIIFPIFLILIWRFSSKLIIWILILVFAVSLGVAHWATVFSSHNRIVSGAFFLLPTRAWELLLGSFSALYLQNNKFLESKLINQFLSCLGLILILYAIFAFDSSTPFPSLYSLIPTIGTVLLILSASPYTLIHKILSFRPIVFMGLISYSAYLWHQPMLAFAKHKFYDDLPSYILIILCVVSIIFAYFTWKLVEQPFRNKKIYTRKKIFLFSFLGILFFSSAGFYINKTNGFLNMHSNERKVILKNYFNPGEYVMHEFVENILKDFPDNSDKRTVLVIGDSFAQDLVNAIYESDLKNSIEFSTYYIPAACGVLMIKHEKIKNFIESKCNQHLFSNKKLQHLMKTADEIWLASAWQEWNIQFLGESFQNIKSLNQNLIVFGKKHFGNINSHIYLSLPIQEWSQIRDFDYEGLNDLNDSVKYEAQRNNAIFINTQEILCNGEIRCSNFVNGNIISYDGGHLTPFGANFLGSRLLVEQALGIDRILK
jgi:peptidoglycan/LPS O-acetylase OafA/YrhL